MPQEVVLAIPSKEEDMHTDKVLAVTTILKDSCPNWKDFTLSTSITSKRKFSADGEGATCHPPKARPSQQTAGLSAQRTRPSVMLGPVTEGEESTAPGPREVTPPEWKGSLPDVYPPLLDDHERMRSGDFYDEEHAERDYLESKPTCFVVFGKTGAGGDRLARKIADSWGCVYIHPDSVVGEELDDPGDVGDWMLRRLSRGECVPMSVVLALVSRKVRSPEVAHRGYVLTGLPYYAPEDKMSVSEQLEIIFHWTLEPSILVYVMCPDRDVIFKRSHTKFDYRTGRTVSRSFYDLEKKVHLVFTHDKRTLGDILSEDVYQDFEHERALTSRVVDKHLVRLHVDSPGHVLNELARYKEHVLPAVELYILQHDPHFIALPLPHVYQARRMLGPLAPADTEEEEENQQFEGRTAQDCLPEMLVKGTISAKFPWHVSRWGTKCPVSLSEGRLLDGNPEHLVRFLDKIYFLSSEGSLEKFLRNPRPFLLPPNPRPPCKFAVVGPKYSGKTTLAHHLASMFNGKFLCANALKLSYLSQKQKSQQEATIFNSTQEAIKKQNSTLLKEWEEEDEHRKKKYEQWKDKCLVIIKELVDLVDPHESKTSNSDLETETVPSGEKSLEIRSSSKSKARTPTFEDIPENNSLEEIRTFLDNYRIPCINNIPFARDILKAPGLLMDYVPKDLVTQKPPPKLVDKYHPFVKDFVANAVKQIPRENIQVTDREMEALLVESIRQVEIEMYVQTSGFIKYGGWVIDNFPLNVDIWNGLKYFDSVPDSLICLRETPDAYDTLTKIWESRLQTDELSFSSSRPELKSEELLKEFEHVGLKYTPEDTIQSLIEERESVINFNKMYPSLMDANFLHEPGDTDSIYSRKLVKDEQFFKINVHEYFRRNKSSEFGQTKDWEQLDIKDVKTVSGIAMDESTGTKLEESEAGVPLPRLLGKTDVRMPTKELSDPQKPNNEDSLLESKSVRKQEPTVRPPRKDLKGSSQEHSKHDLSLVIPYKKIDVDGVTVDQFVDDYIEGVNNFYSEWDTFKGNADIETTAIEVDIHNKPIEDIGIETVQKIEGKFLMNPLNVKEDEMEDTSLKSEDEDIIQESDGSVFENRPQQWDDRQDQSIASKRQMGGTGIYCPVTFKKDWVLWLGKEDYMVSFKNKLYMLSSEKALEDFNATPGLFASNTTPVNKLPPPRICLIGPIGSGKTSIGHSLSDYLGLIYADYCDVVNEYLIPAGLPKVGRKFKTPETNQSSNQEEIEESVWNPLNELVNSVKEYFMNGSPLPIELAEKAIKRFWKNEPYKNNGFVLKGFPYLPSDMDFMKTHHAIPDVIIELNVSSEVTDNRVFNFYFQKWKDHIEMLKNKREEKIMKTKEAWLKHKEEETNKILLELQNANRNSGSEAKVSLVEDPKMKSDLPPGDPSVEPSDSLTLQSDKNQLKIAEEIFLERFPEPVSESIEWESNTDARERIHLEIQDWYDSDIENLESLKALAEEENIPWFTVNGEGDKSVVMRQVLYHIDRFVHKRSSLFDRPFTLTIDQAERLLEIGYYFPSRFVRECPVQVHNQVHLSKSFIPWEERNNHTPVAVKGHVYFPHGAENLAIFSQDPIKYINQSVQSPRYPFKMAVIGPPKSGKSSLSRQLCKSYGMKHITLGQSVRHVLGELSWSKLAQDVDRCLREGGVIPCDIAAKCVEAATLDPHCVTQGFILDGFPNTVGQMKELRRLAIVPFLVLALRCDVGFSLAALKQETKSFYRQAPTFSTKFLDLKFRYWEDSSEEFLRWVSGEYQNLVFLEARKSKWGMLNGAKDAMFKVMGSIKRFFQNSDEAKPRSLEWMCVTPREFQERQGKFMHYCPLCFVIKNELISSYYTPPPDRKGMVSYLDQYYWICEEHLAEFTKNSEKYVRTLTESSLPVDLPTVVDLATLTHERLHEQGHCIVTYWDNLPQRVVVKGSPSVAVSYREKIYLFCEDECLRRFFKRPDRYHDRKILSGGITPLPPLLLPSLPPLGYLEQVLYEVVRKSVTAVSADRPKYPGLDGGTSAALEMALHLKTHNPLASRDSREVYGSILGRFRDKCRGMESAIKRFKSRSNPYEVPDKHQEERRKRISAFTC
uniref:Nucleoside-diphosphate kinase n=1 Tax=Timema poppense TaxID=170557 RepID=A0A7R9DF79_TIMPO|nr:unnamed protein product [Timema poppensis]